MKKSRFLALILALAMLLSLGSFGTALAEEAPMEISLCFWDLVELNEDDPMLQKIEQDLGIKLTVLPMTWDNEIEMKLLWAASDSLPDIISTYTVEEDLARFYQWLQSGLTRSIPQALIDKYPTVKTFVDSNVAVQAVKAYTNEISFIPRPFSMKNTFLFDQGCGFYIRKDWLRNLGLEEPKTVDEFYTVLEAFTNNDPDQNGKNDTYGLVLTRGIPGAIFSWWGVELADWVVDEADGQLKPAYLTDAGLPAFEFLNKCYNEGLIDPEYATNSTAAAQQKFAQGSFGVYYKNVDDLSVYKQMMKQFGPAQGITSPAEVVDLVGVLNPIVANEGDQARWPAITDYSGSEISAKVSDEKLDKILELYEYLLTPEMQRLLRFGYEGKEYTIENDEVVPMINPETELPYDVAAIYPASRLYCLASWAIDTDIESNMIPQEIKDVSKVVRDAFNPIAKGTNLPIFVMSTPAKDALAIDTRSGYNDIVMTGGDVAEAMHDWQAESMEKGLTEAIAEVNAKADEMGLK